MTDKIWRERMVKALGQFEDLLDVTSKELAAVRANLDEMDVVLTRIETRYPPTDVRP